jgi:Rrf2 family transcriptional regulator, iron-sulfur cluster assembly transcription factor
LEIILAALVREGILKGSRGPRGGYELARERHKVTANDILRAAGAVDESGEKLANIELLKMVVLPALAKAEQKFGIAIEGINLEEMARSAEALKS